MPLILVIEDETPIRTNLVKILKFNGFEAVGAEDGAKGIELARRCVPDLIVCDIMMPGLNGHQVLTTLVQDLETATIPFIFLSAKSDRADIRQGMDLGADDYLTKPFSDKELIQAIQSRLKKQEAVRQPALDAVKQAVGKLNELAYYDALTQLPNRILLHQQLGEVVLQPNRQRQLIAVLYLQLNHHRNISKTFGYSSVGRLLQAIAQRLTQWTQAADLVARMNESEFCVVLVRESSHDVKPLVEDLLNHLAAPYTIEEQEIRAFFSMGVALYGEDSNSPDKILAHAALALRRQTTGTNSYQFYSTEIAIRSVEQSLLQVNLYQALERSEFELYYQPQVNLVTGRITGAEALLRWHHPDLGLLTPDVFLAIAEETGLIIPIGEWVLQTACTEAQVWQTLHHSPVRVAVNLTGQQVKQPTFVDQAIEILNRAQLPPELLEVEITETGLMEDVEAITRTLNQLKALKVQVSIDDFGTGYSSLACLKNLSIDTLKIDPLFVNDITADAKNASIVLAIIAMAHSLKLKVLAKGVETQAQLNFLKQHGCHSMQGVLFSQPLPAHQFREMLTTNLRLERN